MPDKTVKSGFMNALRANNGQLRQKIARLIDDVFEAYRATGRPGEEYTRTQWFESILFQSVNEIPLTAIEERGALQLIVRFEERLVDYYTLEAARKSQKAKPG